LSDSLIINPRSRAGRLLLADRRSKRLRASGGEAATDETTLI
jgi:hypothetical protein